MDIQKPELPQVPVVDYDITLACGRDIQFTLRPDLGDTEERVGEWGDRGSHLRLKRSTGHEVVIRLEHAAIVSRRAREMTDPMAVFERAKAEFDAAQRKIDGRQILDPIPE